MLLGSSRKKAMKDLEHYAKEFAHHLVSGEEAKAVVQIGLSYYVLTTLRLVQLSGLPGEVKASFPLAEISSFRSKAGHQEKFFITINEKEKKLGGILEMGQEFLTLFEELHKVAPSSDELRTESLDAAGEPYESVKTNRESKFPKHLVKSIQRNAKTGEDPVMVISGVDDSTEGSLIVFADRCVISKSGFWAAAVSGSLGGARDALFYFADITGIEYNSGFLSGVLEILTPSYQGTATKDYWSGLLNSDRNNSENDPRVTSNTLPLLKSDYRAAKPLIDELRSMIAAAKAPTVTVQLDETTPKASAADEIKKLAELHEAGSLTDDEFATLKGKLLS